MALRDMKTTVEKHTAPHRGYDLTFPEMQELYRLASDVNKRYGALVTAFEYGFILGGRHQKAKRKHRAA